jgi:hypothetical protein
MAQTRAWRAFRRTEDSACLFASLIYAGAALHGWSVLPGDGRLKMLVMVAAPGAFLAFCVVIPLVVAPLRRLLSRFVWLSFTSGFGQTPVSILSGLGVLVFAAGFIFAQIHGVAHGGRYPAGVFSGYAAGIGVLFAQAVLIRGLERDPDVRPRIEESIEEGAGGGGDRP